MTRRGQQTRERLLDATRRTVRDLGYAHTTTRAIAHDAGVTEATIYRHFPDKRALFFAALLERNPSMLDELADLSSRVGQGTVQENLAWALERLAALRDEVLPLELALLTDPQMAFPGSVPLLGAPGDGDATLPGPPGALATYLAEEQRIGRVRAEIDPTQAAVVLLVLLFGMSLHPRTHEARTAAVDAAIGVVVLGIGAS